MLLYLYYDIKASKYLLIIKKNAILNLERWDNMDWNNLYEIATQKNNPKKISPFTSTGYITCLIESTDGNIYTGSNIISTTELNMSAEKNALSKMISKNDYIVGKMLLVNEIGELLKPNFECLYYFLDFISPDTEILIDLKDEKTIKFFELIPDWWGTFRVSKD